MRRHLKVEVVWKTWDVEAVVEETTTKVTGTNNSVLTFSVVVEQYRIELTAILIGKPVNAKVKIVGVCACVGIAELTKA